jgi:ABC-type nickel/cobalt efflux system permease component RcnA
VTFDYTHVISFVLLACAALGWTLREMWALRLKHEAKAIEDHKHAHARIDSELLQIRNDLGALGREIRLEFSEHRKMVHERLNYAQSALIDQQKEFMIELQAAWHDSHMKGTKHD